MQLKAATGPLTVNEIMSKTKRSESAIRNALSRLVRRGEVEVVKVRTRSGVENGFVLTSKLEPASDPVAPVPSCEESRVWPFS